jgi:hypothetical protein
MKQPHKSFLKMKHSHPFHCRSFFHVKHSPCCARVPPSSSAWPHLQGVRSSGGASVAGVTPSGQARLPQFTKIVTIPNLTHSTIFGFLRLFPPYRLDPLVVRHQGLFGGACNVASLFRSRNRVHFKASGLENFRRGRWSCAGRGLDFGCSRGGGCSLQDLFRWSWAAVACTSYPERSKHRICTTRWTREPFFPIITSIASTRMTLRTSGWWSMARITHTSPAGAGSPVTTSGERSSTSEESPGQFLATHEGGFGCTWRSCDDHEASLLALRIILATILMATLSIAGGLIYAGLHFL